MKRIAALALRDLLVLWRDRAGLAVLFLMPAALVLVVSLVHDSALRNMRGNRLDVLYANRDPGPLGRALREGLAGAPAVRLHDLAAAENEAARGRAAVRAGRYRALIEVPADASRRLEELRDGLWPPIGTNAPASALPLIRVTLDPVLPDLSRSLLLTSVARAVSAAEMGIVLAGIAGPAATNRPASAVVPGEAPRGPHAGMFAGVVEAEPDGGRLSLPTATQQNVPAWTLFAMFFVVVPLAGQMISERHQGIERRILVAPVGHASVLGAKVLVYAGVCLLQFLLMLAIGFWILPLFGSEPLEVGRDPWALVLVAGASALAACGYGVAVGTAARTHQQASTFGAVSVVLAAALGGVMVPVFAMPAFLQPLSRLSPLAWGLSGFLDVFLRSAGVRDVLPAAGALMAFFLLCLVLSFLFRAFRRGAGD